MWTSFQLVKLVWTELLNVQGGQRQQRQHRSLPRRIHTGAATFHQTMPLPQSCRVGEEFRRVLPRERWEVLSEDTMKRGLKFPSEASEGGTVPVLSWRMAPFSAKDDSANN